MWILIVAEDKDQQYDAALTAAVEVEGVEVSFAATAMEAKESLENNKFDAVVSRVTIPFNNDSPKDRPAGLLVAAWAHKQDPGMPVILLPSPTKVPGVVKRWAHREKALLFPGGGTEIDALDFELAYYAAKLMRQK